MNANSTLNVLGGILDAMLANLVETIDKRVEAKVITLTERIERLETDLKNATPVVRPTDDVILRLDKLEARLAGEQPDTTKFDLCILDSEEFRTAVIKVIDQQVMEDTFLDPLVEAVTDSDKFNDRVNTAAVETARSEAEEMISDHCSDYDHDDIHETSDHEVDEDAVKDIIKEVLNNTTVTLKI